MLNGNGFNAQTYLESFGSNFNLALGANNDIDLRMLCQSHGQQKGSAYWIKSYKPKVSFNPDTQTYREQEPRKRDLTKSQEGRATDGTISRREWEANKELQTYKNDFARRTPHQDIDFYQTLVEPEVIETGHEFETLDELLENNDPTSPTISMLVSAFKRKRNMQVIAAITAASVIRKKYNATTGLISSEPETFDANVGDTHNYETAQADYFSLKTDAPKVRAILDAANVPDKTKVPVLVNPHDFAETCINSFDQWADIPYVTKQDIENGTMPDSFGLSFIKCNEIPKGKMYAWLPQAIAYVPWRSLSQKMGEDATYRFHPRFYAEEAQGFARVDDWGVVKINIKSKSA